MPRCSPRRLSSRRLAILLVMFLASTACTDGVSSCGEVTLPPPGERTLEDFEILSDQNRDEYGDERLGDGSSVESIGAFGLILHGVETLPPEDAGKLAAADRDVIALPDLSELSAESAAELSEWNGANLYLGGVTVDAAEALVGWEGTLLNLHGSDRIDPALIDAVVDWTGYYLVFADVERLSTDVARRLTRWDGEKLAFPQLTELPPDAAAHLANWDGMMLEIGNLDHLDENSAEELAEFDGQFFWSAEDLLDSSTGEQF